MLWKSNPLPSSATENGIEAVAGAASEAFARWLHHRCMLPPKCRRRGHIVSPRDIVFGRPFNDDELRLCLARQTAGPQSLMHCELRSCRLTTDGTAEHRAAPSSPSILPASAKVPRPLSVADPRTGGMGGG